MATAMLLLIMRAPSKSTFVVLPPCPGCEPGGQMQGTRPFPHSQVMLRTVTLLTCNSKRRQ